MTRSSPAWQDAYSSRLPLYTRLEEEVKFTLGREIERAGIKLHSLTARVKALDRLSQKAERKQWTDPLEEAVDIVGARVVVLFMSDLPRIHEIVASAFDVFSRDDKIEGAADPSTFGYMSTHYGATISSSHSGPRYDELRDLRFEIQTRTILMDAWANVSHHLAYTDESSIPQELRRDFNALSGLFYVADKHFEMFFARSRAVEQQASVQLNSSTRESLELNLETFSAFLKQRYPERPHSERDAVARLVSDLRGFGFTDLRSLEAALDKSRDRFEQYEAKLALSTPSFRYTDVGVVRASLRRANPRFAAYDRGRRSTRGRPAARRS